MFGNRAAPTQPHSKVTKTWPLLIFFSIALGSGLRAEKALGQESGRERGSEETRRSPYFIDGIHCEGIEELDPGEDLTRSYPDEVADIGIKTRRQVLCESIFAKSGVAKFQWVTPEDLEKLSFILKHSKRFQSADLRIEKSELQNHIHLIGRFTMFEAKHQYRINFKQAFEGNAQDGQRVSSVADAAIHFNKRGVVNPAPFVLGIKYRSSNAKDPLKPNPAKTTLSDNEAIALGREDGRYVAITSKFQQANGLYFGADLETTDMSGDKYATLDGRIEVGTEFQLDPLIPSTTRLNLFYTTYSASGYEFNDSKQNSKSSHSLVFAGFKEDIQSRWVKGYVQMYRSITPELHYFGNADLSVPLGRLWGSTQGFGIASEVVRGSILPEHRFGLPDRSFIQYYYQADQTFAAMNADHKISLRLGVATFDAVNNLSEPYSKDQAYGEILFKTQNASFETNLGFLIGNRRLF
jgi:hypothetical protein